MFTNPQTVTFASGFKARYFFSSVVDELEDDFLEELKSYSIRGPLSEEISKNSPLFKEALLSRRLLLDLIRYYKTKSVGSLSVSLSHTKNSALVAAASTLAFEGYALAQGLGADLESAQRRLSEAAHKRIVNGGLDSKLSALELWSLKEAAYKAHPNNENLLLKDFIVSDIEELTSQKNLHLLCTQTQKTFEAVVLQERAYVLSFARIT